MYLGRKSRSTQAAFQFGRSDEVCPKFKDNEFDGNEYLCIIIVFIFLRGIRDGEGQKKS